MNALGILHLMQLPLLEECNTSFFGEREYYSEFIGRKVVTQLEPSFPLIGSEYY